MIEENRRIALNDPRRFVDDNGNLNPITTCHPKKGVIMPFRSALCAAFFLLCTMGSRADAQQIASSLDELKVLVSTGDTISVRDSGGTETTGKIEGLSTTSLTLLTSNGPREFRESEIAAIRQRRSDSVVNGAVIGAISTSVPLAVFAASIKEPNDSAGRIVAGVAAGAGVGALIGAGIDAAIRGRKVIYERPSRTGRVNVAPLVTAGCRGLAIYVAF